MIQSSIVLLLSLHSVSPDAVLVVSANLSAGVMTPGGQYEFLVEVAAAEGWSASGAGVPAPLLQIDVPPSVNLLGEVLTTHQELSRNEFLQAPFELLLKDRQTRIPFTLVEAPRPGEHFGLNILAYLTGGPGDGERFVRRRLHLPLAANAVASRGSDSNSSWGMDRDLLQIGQVADNFNLPKAHEQPVGLGNYLGEKNILVVTYRAHW